MGVHVGYEANDSSLKHSSPVYGVSVFFLYILHCKVELKLFYM